MDIGSRMRAGRKALGKTQERIARESGLSLNVIARLERGEIENPHVATLAAVAAALDLPTSALLGEAPSGPEPALAGKA